MVFEKSLTAMVKGIRAHRGRETEYINACLQEIQKEVTSKNMSTKSMAILKLAYLTMFGYDMNWSTFAVVEVMSHSRFSIKRPGYLASAISFTDGTDVGLLTINLFKKDFGGKSQYETGLAISCLSSICTPEICRDIIGDLMSMLSSSRAYLRKKTVLCLYRIFLKDPPALRTCFPKLKERLGDEDQGVLTATVNTFLELARKNAKNYLSLVPQLYHILVNTTNNWLSIKLLKLFQLLCPWEPRLPAKLVEPLTNLLNTTKAQSVEFEAIRCTLRTMPDDSSITALAIEKLQSFLNSSDRNLRFLALDMFKEVLGKPQFRERFDIPDLHSKVLTSIEESDTTARKIALQLLDRILSPATFADAVKKLLEFSKNACPPDEFFGTILRIGARDCYALVEDFEWYLLVLAEITRSRDSDYAGQAAAQFGDVTARVPEVRPCAVTLALGLLDRSTAGGSSIAGAASSDPGSQTNAQTKEGTLDVAMPMVGSCAWVIGEYHDAFERPAEALFVKASRALLAKHIHCLEPSIQTQCIWAATKLYLGSPKLGSPGVVAELNDMLTLHLPAFARSTHVDVSERATLAWHLSAFFKGDAARVDVGKPLCDQPLLPVRADAQRSMPVPDDLNLDEPFFVQQEAQKVVFAPVRADPTDPYSLAATYKDDFGFLTAKESIRPVTSVPSVDQNSSMFYLLSKGQGSTEKASAETEGPATKAAPADPLEQMRERLAAARLGGTGAMKYSVLREEVQAPIAPSAAAVFSPGGPSMPVPASTEAAMGSTLPLPTLPEKELAELQGRLWSMCYSDDRVRVYYCIKSKNARKQLLRIELRCEKVDSQDLQVRLSDIAVRFPAGVAVQEAGEGGLLSLSAGELQDRAKVRATIALAPFLAPITCVLQCELQYSFVCHVPEACIGQDFTRTTQCVELQLPSTTVLVPAVMNEDDLAAFMAQRSAELLSNQTAQTLSLSVPGRSTAAICEELPAIVGRAAGLCHFHGLQHDAGSSQSKGQKFLLIAQPPPTGQSILPGQEPLPNGALVVCLFSGLGRDCGLDIRVTVKACRKDVCDDICSQLTSVFQDLVEGRLRAD